MDTIFALATAPGKAGIAVVRVSGTQALATLAALKIAQPRPRTATLATLLLPDGLALDKAIILFFPSPASFTGEDCLEYHLHGGRAILKSLFALFATLPDLRPAEPGEFARRAFLNGKMDLTAAEGLADLIDAETESQRRQAYRIMQGESAAFYNMLRGDIVSALALYEAYIDFPDEDIPHEVLQETQETVFRLSCVIEGQLNHKAAERVRDGIRVVIIGPPNAGKSSLLNSLARRDVAIVSEMAGTTRDVIEVHMDIGGYAVTLADTAGIREARDAVEREGINRSFLSAEKADIRIFVLDGSDGAFWHNELANGLLPLIKTNDIVLCNKCDLGVMHVPQLPQGILFLPLSVKSGIGMDELLKLLGEKVDSRTRAETVFVTQQRHRYHLQEALGHLRNYSSSKAEAVEIRCEELRRAALEIGKITGFITTDAVLDVIFSRFCIGK